MKVISAGLPRSGSTLVMQMLKVLYEGVPLQKVHGYMKPVEQQIRACTYRHPFAAAVSNARIHNDLSNLSIKNSALYIKKMAREVDKYMKDKKTVMLRYEDFYSNRELVVEAISHHYDIKFSDKLVCRALEYSSIDKNIKRQKSYDNFSQWDPETQIHGGHISEHRGNPDSWCNLVDEEKIRILKSVLNPVLSNWGYQ